MSTCPTATTTPTTSGPSVPIPPTPAEIRQLESDIDDTEAQLAATLRPVFCCCVLEIVAALCLMACFWASFGWLILLAFVALIAGIIGAWHFRHMDAFQNSACCCSPLSAFTNQVALQPFVVVLSAAGLGSSIGAYFYYRTGEKTKVMSWFSVAAIGCTGVLFVASLIASVCCCRVRSLATRLSTLEARLTLRQGALRTPGGTALPATTTTPRGGTAPFGNTPGNAPNTPRGPLGLSPRNGNGALPVAALVLHPPSSRSAVQGVVLSNGVVSTTALPARPSGGGGAVPIMPHPYMNDPMTMNSACTMATLPPHGSAFASMSPGAAHLNTAHPQSIYNATSVTQSVMGRSANGGMVVSYYQKDL